MRSSVFKAAPLLIAPLILAACSTPQKRAEQNPEMFAALSQDEQRLVLEGRIREGMNQDAVFIALGRPSRETEARLGGRDHLNWIYSRIVSREIPNYSRRYYRGADGSIYSRCYYDPYYDSYIVDTFRVIFEDGKVVGWEELY